jgi:predicted alpha/beta hydrolase family esterase
MNEQHRFGASEPRPFQTNPFTSLQAGNSAAPTSADSFAAHRVVVAPGLRNSGPHHWQSAWQRRFPQFTRVEQDDWETPNLDAWARRIVETVLRAAEPVVVVAHSFGCLATLRAAAFQSGLIEGALLVAPADPASFGLENKLTTSALDFPTTLVASDNDPWMAVHTAAHWAERWGSTLVRLNEAGHINMESGFTEWPEGLRLLERLCRRVAMARRGGRVASFAM